MTSSTTHQTETDAVAIELFARRVAMLYQNARSAIFMATGVAVVFAVVMWPVIPDYSLGAWIAAMVLVNIARYVELWAYFRAVPSSAEMKPWLTRFTIGAAISGSVWGSAGVLFIPEKYGIYQAFTILTLCGIAGAASTAYASVLSVYRAYVFPIAIPVIIYMFYIGDSVHIGLGVTITLFLVLTSQRTVLMMHNTLVQSMKFGLENAALVKNLEAAVVRYQQAQADIAEMSELNKTVIQHTDSGIMAYKTDGECVLMNEAAAKMMSLSLEKGIKTNFNNLPIWKKSGLLEVAQNVLSTGMQQVCEAPMRTIYGEDIWLVAHLWRISKGNQPILLVVAHDIADHKKIEHTLQQAKEAAEKAARIKSQFLTDISYTLNEPVNKIINLSDATEPASTDAVTSNTLAEIRATATQLADVIGNMIDFSRVETTGQGLEPHHFLLDHLLDEVWDSAEIYAKSKTLKLIRTVGEDVPNALIEDGARLRQILTLLMGNAIKHTERGHVILSIAKRSQVGLRLFLECSVSDTGIGMTPEQLQQALPDDVTQVREDGKQSLAAWKKLVGQMGGHVSVTSNVGEGSTFSFTFSVELDTDV